MEKKLKILLLEDNNTDAKLIQRLLEKSSLNFELKRVANRTDYLKELDEFCPDIILSDNTLPRFTGAEALQLLRERSRHLPFILVTGTVSEEFAATVMKLGADDYILKDRMIRLPAAIETALKQRRLEKEKLQATDQLVQNEIKYRSIFSKSPLPKWIYDLETLRFLEVNEAAVKQYGYTPEEFYAMTIKDIRPEKEIPILMEDLDKIKEGSGSRHGYWRHRKKNGEIIFVETTAHSISYNEKKARMVVIKDVTEEIKASEELVKSEEKYRTLVEQAFDAIIVYSIEGIIIDCNNTACNYTGYAKKELKKLNVQELFFKEDLASRPLYFETLKIGNPTYDYRRIKRKDGTYLEMEISSKMMPDGNLMAIARDITERKKAEEEIKKSNERFQYATKASSDIIWELNFEAKQYLVHEGKERLFGKGSVIDWKLGMEGNYVVEEDRDKVRQSFGEARRDPSRTLWELEYRVNSSDNSILYIINHAIFIRNEKGKAIRAIGAITDVTDRKRLEIELLEQQRKEQLKITATALEAQEKERTAIGIELHDNVNQILAATKMNLKMTKTDSAQVKETIETSIEYIDQAIAENRKIAHALVTPDLKMADLTQQLKELMRIMLEKTGIKIHFSKRSFNDKMLNDPQRIAVYRIAQEQCTNIIKYAKANSVTISLDTSSSSFKMVIADDGKGMEKNKKMEGIGLRNINSRLSVFNGSAKIDTAPGKGFKLEIEIPLAENLL